MVPRVVFFSERCIPHIGGVEKHVYKLCFELSKMEKVDAESKLFTDVGDRGVCKIGLFNVVHLNSVHSKCKKIVLGCSPFILKHSLKADVVHYHDYSTVLGYGFGTFLCRFVLGKRQFITFHGWEGVFPPLKKVRLVRKLIWRLTSGSIQIGAFITKWYGTISDVCSVGAVELNQFGVKQCRSESGDGKITSYFVGRLASDTGVLELLDAWICANRKLPNIHTNLVLYGDGPLRGELNAIVRQSPVLMSKILFKGAVKNPFNDIPHYSLVLCSGYLSILEAFANKCSVISFYDHQLKRDYLESFAIEYEMLDACGSKMQLYNVLCGYRFDEERINRNYLYAVEQSWSRMSNLYISLWDRI